MYDISRSCKRMSSSEVQEIYRIWLEIQEYREKKKVRHGLKLNKSKYLKISSKIDVKI